MCYNQAIKKGGVYVDYQMNKAMGKCFKGKDNHFTGRVRILGSYYDYKVIEGIPHSGAMLEVVDFTSRELLVQVNDTLKESDVNYLG